MVLWQVVGNAVYILQYLLLGAYSGCAGIAVYTIANAVVCFHHDTRKLWQGWKLVFSAILLAVSVLTWKDWASILPLIGSVGVIWSNWSKDEKTIRLGKLLCVIPHGKINPLIGSAGVSAVPMAARVAQKVGSESDPHNFLLMHAMGPNVAGVIGSAVAAGFFMLTFGG